MKALESKRSVLSRFGPRAGLRVGLPVLAAFGTVSALGYARGRFQDGQLFLPEPFPAENWDPDYEGLAVEDRWFPSAEGRVLHGWWHWRPEAEACILYCHGNSGSLAQRIKVLRHLAALPANVFAFDYRGYGRSQGRPSEAGLYQDVRAAFRFLVEGLGQRAERIVLFGHSLGGAVAIDGALELPAAGLVVEASFTDVRSMARVRFQRLPAHWIARNQFRSIEKVASLALPKLIIHGTGDKTVPFDMGRRLFEASREPKGFLAIERGGHSDLYLRGGEAYRQALRGFVERCVAS